MATEVPYIARIESMLTSRPYLGQLSDILKQEEGGKTQFSLFEFSPLKSPVIQKSTTVQESRNIIEQNSTVPRFRICVIENISPSFIDLVGSAWDLDVEFFVDHALGCRGDLSRVPLNLPSTCERASFLFIDAVLSYNTAELQRVLGDIVQPPASYLYRRRKHYFRRDFRFRTDGKGFQLDTRTSYYAKRLNDDDWLGKIRKGYHGDS
jgi:hypothetical protein